jgi:hypothetical protein
MIFHTVSHLYPIPLNHFTKSYKPSTATNSDILFMDVAQFTCNCIDNTQNSHSLAHQNPHEAAESNVSKDVQ